MNACLPLPNSPYTITQRGEVYNRLGVLLRVDEYGRVSLPNASGARKKRFIGDLLAEAGFFISGTDKEALARAEALAEDAERRVAMLEAEVDGLHKKLEKENFELAGARCSLENARKANALLIGIKNDLNRRLTELERKAKAPSPLPKAKGRPKRAAAVPFHDALDAPPEVDFEDVEDLL